jgi:hypothetical protein
VNAIWTLIRSESLGQSGSCALNFGSVQGIDGASRPHTSDAVPVFLNIAVDGGERVRDHLNIGEASVP